jgi:hypothetical protein
VGAADAGGRERALHRVGGVIVKLEELLRRPLPVADVRLVPQLPVPALDLGAAILFDRVADPLKDQFRPLRVIARRVRPAGENRVVCLINRPFVAVRLRFDRERFGHKSDLDQRLHSTFDISVDDAVDDRPIVTWLAGGVFGIGVGRTPFERRRPVAGREQVVRPYVDWRGAERRKLREELLAVFHVSVIRLVIAEETPDRLHRPLALRRVNADRDAIRLGE